MSNLTPEVAAHNLLRHVPPKEVEDRMYDVIKMNPDVAEDLLVTTDIQFQTEICPEAHRPFIKCDFNRDWNSYRSPFTSKYVPDYEEGVQPPEKLREMEKIAMKGLEQYKLLFYGKEGVGSCYTWELSETEFGLGVFMKKEVSNVQASGTDVFITGWINSSDVFVVSEVGGGKFNYDLVSSVLMDINVSVELGEPISLSGSLGHKREQVMEASSPLDHVANVFTMIEEVGKRFISHIHEIYIGKTCEILSRCRGTSDEPRPGQSVKVF